MDKFLEVGLLSQIYIFFMGSIHNNILSEGCYQLIDHYITDHQ